LDSVRSRPSTWRRSAAPRFWAYRTAPAASPWARKPICRSSGGAPAQDISDIDKLESSSRTGQRTIRSYWYLASKAWLVGGEPAIPLEPAILSEHEITSCCRRRI
jgi:hypothetical protein